ncbi:protein ref(2)P [Musca domestica]|uniref:Protein ref(2)P n=1 Tax=Musca domestica TaxID=7370 RepID=A0A1I8MP83_MUSDO|nr:protein ref(2)P [Musca domestica]
MSSLMKFTYNSPNGKKINGYLKESLDNFEAIKATINRSLFQEHKEKTCEIRYYWIDQDGDEIDIVNQNDMNIFNEMCFERRHLYVAPKQPSANDKEVPAVNKSQDATTNAPSVETNIPTATGPTNAPTSSDAAAAVHLNVECDSCLMAPIVGFRYKCIQCPNYDLCQHCEAKHVHGDHMMIRMPNNNCPYVVDAWITAGAGCGRKLGRKHHHGHHEKRWKSSTCAATAAGASTTGDATASNGDGEKSGRKHGRRHARHSFLSHLYEMMHDLAEGGGEAAAAAAAAAAASAPAAEESTKTPTENIVNEAIAKAAAEAANTAALKAHEAAVKSAEIAAKVIHETSLAAAAKEASPSSTTSADKQEENKTKSSTPSTSAQATPTMSATPSLQDFVQLLDPKLLKGGMEILNNFNDMFAKMLDPMDGAEGGEASCPFAANLRRSSNISQQSGNSQNSMNSSKTSNTSTTASKAPENNKAETKKTPEEVTNGLLDVSDLGSDSESDSVSESFIKLNAPSKEASPETAAGATTDGPSTSVNASTSTTPPKSLDKSKVMDFAQISADLKAHIDKMETEERKADSGEVPVEMRAVPVFPKPAEQTQTSTPSKPEEKRNVPVYHQDEFINSSIHAMMSMGFSNEGAWLTQLLESVNGNIPEALDLISATQRKGR